jgi:hypothetical protein
MIYRHVGRRFEGEVPINRRPTAEGETLIQSMITQTTGSAAADNQWRLQGRLP